MFKIGKGSPNVFVSEPTAACPGYENIVPEVGAVAVESAPRARLDWRIMFVIPFSFRNYAI